MTSVFARRSFSRFMLALAAIVATAPLGHAQTKTKFLFGTNWYPQAEHGGFFEAKASGIWASKGVDVDLSIGGPQVNTAQLLATGVLDFAMISNSFIPLNFVKEGIPMVAIAAVFQKDPQALMVHEESGVTDLKQMVDKRILISTDARSSYWPFLKSKYGFKDDMARPYTYNIAPFMADKTAIQQCYISNEPYSAQTQGAKVRTFLLADYEYQSYSHVIMASQKLVDENPEVVQKVVDGFIEAWYKYLYGDGSAANKAIATANADWTPDRTVNSIKVMKEAGLVDSGDALKLGIGAMTDARWKQFFDDMVAAGLYTSDLNYKKAYTLKFVNKGHGMAMKK